MNWPVWGLAAVAYGAVPLVGFALSRRAALVWSVPVLAALFATGLWATVRGDTLGLFDGFVPFFLGLSALVTAHLGVTGLLDKTLRARFGWAQRPALLRHGATGALIATGYASVLLWPQID